MKKLFYSLALLTLLVFQIHSTALCQSDMKEDNDASSQKSSMIKDLYSQVELFSYALTTIQSEYVDEKTPQDLIYGSLKGMLSSLDPHSQFLNPEDYKELKTETQGKFGGLGIEISIRDGLLTIITPIEDTPAWKEGLKAGDRIVKIEEELTKDITLNEAVKKLRGEPGTKITITVFRESEYKIYNFTITREIIEIEDVKDTQILEDNIGYIRLVEFREDSNQEVRKAMEQLKEEGADSLILDLRNNPGGLLDVAINITQQFLRAGDTIVSTKGRRTSQNLESIAKDIPGKILDWPMVVLINEGSASGSEILAGALQDNRRAVILGGQSFGKGSVQSVIPLPDGSALRLTTSKYFTPSGKSIHGTGITPDIIVERKYPKLDEDEKEIKEKEEEIDKVFEDVELQDTEDPRELELKKREKERREYILEDNQVQSAISVIKGIKVYKKMNGPVG